MNTFTTSWARLSNLTSVLIKVAMALSGLGMAIWLTLHMAGNLLWLLGPNVMNAYAALLHGSGVLWPVRSLLVVGFVVHVTGALATTRRAHAARPVPYRTLRARASTPASRSMRWTGAVLLGFTVYHVATVYGLGRPVVFPPSAHQNLSALLLRPWDALLLAAASGLVALHLSHGITSAFTSLGLVTPRFELWLRRALGLWVGVVTTGFAVLPAVGWLLV